MSSPAHSLPEELTERVLTRLGLSPHRKGDYAALEAVYDAWCRKVPFDNVAKLIHVRSWNPAPLPGGTAETFFENWLRHGVGGTCWSNAGALHALICALGFHAELGIATMMAAPNAPPNHGTVQVHLDGERFLLDGAILHGKPLRLLDTEPTAVSHPAWGVQCAPREGHLHVQWRPMHKPEGFECRLESFGASAAEYLQRYEQTRDWSPFNYQLNARTNRGNEVVGIAFGHFVTLRDDGGVQSQPCTEEERRSMLIEVFGMSEEIVSQLPADIPTPPPPGSRTAALRDQEL